MLRLSRLFSLIPALIFFGLLVAALVYLGWWQIVTLFLWQHPMLSWLPVAVGLAAGLLVGALRSLLRPPPAPSPHPGAPHPGAPTVRPPHEEAGRIGPASIRVSLHRGAAILVTIALLVTGAVVTIFFPPNAIVEDFAYTPAAELPQRTQPRLLPRTSVDDDPNFRDAKEIHLVRDPGTGGLLWTGEWEAGLLSGESRGVAIKHLDRIQGSSGVIRAGFERAVSGIGPGTAMWKARAKHPFSRFQYPILVPTGDREAIAVISYLGYKGFPFRRPYFKGVLVYHQDGRIEDLSPEEAARRPELVRTGRLFPERLARVQADGIAKTAEIDGKIKDGKGNRQPFLTSIDERRTVWLTIINERERDRGVRAIVIADSSTGETQVWRPPAGTRLISTEDVIDQARNLPLRFTERRCCDSDGHSYTVTLREVVEPRLAFKDGRPYYLVSVAPTRNLPLTRAVERTLLIDARTGRRLDDFRHVEGGPSEDQRLQRFFEDRPPRKRRARR